MVKNSCKFIIDPDLGERKIGIGTKDKNFWLEQLYNEHAKCEGGESRREVSKRMLSVVNKVLEKYKGYRIVLVSHAAAITFLLLNWCKLLDVSVENKKRKISYKDKSIMDGSFNMPDGFRLEFIDNKISSIERLKL